jgi:hypothetical protein
MKKNHYAPNKNQENQWKKSNESEQIELIPMIFLNQLLQKQHKWQFQI